MACGLQTYLKKNKDKDITRFHARPQPGKDHTAKAALEALVYLAGDMDDVAALLATVMKRAKVDLEDSSEAKFAAKATKVVKNIGTALEKLPKNDSETRCRLLHLVAGEFTRTQLVRHFGYNKVGRKPYDKARRFLRTVGVGGRIVAARRGRRPLAEALKNEVRKFWESRAKPSPRGGFVLEATKMTVAAEIKKALGVHPSQSIPLKAKNIRTPRRATDMCHVCHDYHTVHRRLELYLNKLGERYNKTFETAQDAIAHDLTLLEAHVTRTLHDADVILEQHVTAKNRQNSALKTFFFL